LFAYGRRIRRTRTYPFPFYVALAAIFLAVRSGWHTTALSSFGRHQASRFQVRTRIGVDRATGKISEFAADHVLDGGGPIFHGTSRPSAPPRPSASTTFEGRYHHGRAAFARRDSRIVRGYGTLQTMTALEVLVDEVAASLPLDPIGSGGATRSRPAARP
jgi:CO/xanthine dehydrogenase Mo-binding subunit